MTPSLISRSNAARFALISLALIVPNAALHAQPATPPAAGATATPPATPQANGAAATPAAAPARQSWTSDRRDFAVGDIITILIDDYTITTAIKENTASDSKNRTLDASARLPTGTSKGAGITSRNDASQQTRGSAKRENRFQNEMSVRVVALGKDGLLQVKGSKNINVDKSVQDIVLTGWVRAQDVSPQNMVESYRLADAQIGYASPGPLAKPKQGIISKIAGALWP